ncbi:MAG: class I SAM-dependent methyltransferase [Opitutaceae bacterium]
MIDHAFLKQGIAHSPHQPATCLFRAVELGHLTSERLLPTHGRMLDLGCGDGWILSMLKERLDASWKTTGIDPDDREVELAAHAGCYSDLKVTTGDRLPFEAACFDIVFSNSVLEHIPKVEPVLAEVSRVMAPNGAFVFTVPSSQFTRMLRFPSLLGRFVSGCRVREDYVAYMDRRLAHFYYWDLQKWATELAAVGLKVERHYFYLAAKELQRWETLSHLTAGMAGRLCSSNKHPIELQHQLGIRKGESSPHINLLGRALGALGRIGLRKDIPISPNTGSCLAVIARKI